MQGKATPFRFPAISSYAFLFGVLILLVGLLISGAVMLSNNLILWLILLALVFIPLIAVQRAKNGVLWLLSFAIIADLLKRLLFLFDLPFREVFFLALLVPDGILLSLLINRLILAGQHKLRWPRNKVVVPLTLFVGSAVFMTLLNFRIPLLAKFSALETEIFPILLFFVVLTIPIDLKWLLRAFKLYITVSILAALYAVGQSGVGLFPFEQVWAEKTLDISQAAFDISYFSERYGFFRAFSIFSDHQTFGFFQSVAIILVIVYARITKMHPLLVGIILAIQVAGLFLSFVRATWLLLSIAIAVIVLLKTPILARMARTPQVLLFGLLIVVPLGSYAFSNTFYEAGNVSGGESIVTQRVLQRGTLEARITGWSNLLSSPTSFPIRGKGLADLGFYGNKFGYETTFSGAHNFIVEIIERLGWFGFLVFVWLIYTFAQEASWAVKTPQAPQSIINVAIFGLLVGFLVVSNFSRTAFFTGKVTALTFWWMFAYLVQQGARVRHRNFAHSGNRNDRRQPTPWTS